MKAETTHETDIDVCDLTQAPTYELLYVKSSKYGGAVIFVAERTTKDGGIIWRIGDPDKHTAVSLMTLTWEEMEAITVRPYRANDVITITIGANEL